VQVNVLCAMRDWRVAQALSMEVGDAESCVFRIATNGKDALKAAAELAPDILIVDAVLPGMDGFGVIDRMRDMLGDHVLRVIGGSMMHFADEGFRRRGVGQQVSVPWSMEELCAALHVQMEAFRSSIDFEQAEDACLRAMDMLSRMGMHSELKGYAYLAWAAALAYESEARLEAVRDLIYRPVADRFCTTAQNVERLIRHAVERTMDGEEADGVYLFFGNTIDPTRGKPTNAQCISALAQRLRLH